MQLDIASEYQAKLMIEVKRIDNPLLMKDGSIREENGVRHWPVALYPDIYQYLAFHPNDLLSDDLSDYRTSKAYSYYANGWLSPLFLHHIKK